MEQTLPESPEVAAHRFRVAVLAAVDDVIELVKSYRMGRVAFEFDDDTIDVAALNCAGCGKLHVAVEYRGNYWRYDAATRELTPTEPPR